MSYAGDIPGKGTYICEKCGNVIVLDDDDDSLPVCPACQGEEFIP